MNNLLDIINRCSTFLLDASGVIYCDYIPVPGVQKAIQAMQKKGPVFIVTNNSFQDPKTISENLLKMDIPISETNIISSGHGLQHDQTIFNAIKNKNVYVFGSQNSHHYVYKAECKNIVANLEEAECVVLTSSFRDHTDERLKPITKFLQKNPIPTICCNPDNIVLTEQGLRPVIGYFAKKIEKELGQSFYWVGKPFQNFSSLVGKILTERNIPLTKEICFFDDNIENVHALQTHLGLSGCWITETGISKNINIPLTQKTLSQSHYILPSLSL